MRSLKHIESVLQQLDTFKDPKEWLEQYPTSSHIASRMTLLIESRYNDLSDKTVVDLGCGPGMLSIASVLCGAAHVMAFDIDMDSLEIARENVHNVEMEDSIDLFQLNLYQLLPSIKIPKHYKQSNESSKSQKSQKSRKSKKKKNGKYGIHRGKQPKRNDLNAEDHDKFVFMLSTFKKMSIRQYNIFDYNRFWNIRSRKLCDVVIMNPPFGTKGGNEHIDILFLLIAMKMARQCVYSLHKSSTTHFLMQFLDKFKIRGNNEDGDDEDSSLGIAVDSVEVMAQLRFDLNKVYKWHKQKSKDIQVDLLRIKMCEVCDQ